MINNTSFVLQLCGGTFPTGGFSQSYGLETYVSQGKVNSIETFREYLKNYLSVTIGTFEGVVLLEAYDCATIWELDRIKEIDSIVNAMMLTKETREASNRTGKSLLRVASQMLEDDDIKEFYEAYGKKGISGAVAMAAVCGKLGIDKDITLESYIFSTLNGLVQSGIKLIPLGNVEAQKLLFEMNDVIRKIVELSKTTEFEEITNFSPALDIASMQHEFLPTRLYMS